MSFFVKRFFPFDKAFSRRTQFLIAVWMLFAALVWFDIDGSSAGYGANRWSGEPYAGYVFRPLVDFVKEHIDLAGEIDVETLFMARNRPIRSDEYLGWTPWALSQAAHDPPFPVRNTNVGSSTNMLMINFIPVWHIAALARPVTWGYFFLSPERGHAWYWWFQVFGCFTVLTLLFEVILRGQRRLAAFGAFWFCSSAYVVCWSLWPAYTTFFPAIGCLAAYHLCRSTRPTVRILCGILLGLSLPGFVMILYPPWMVPLGLLFFLVFVGLFARDKLYRFGPDARKSFFIGTALAVIVAGGLLAAFFITVMPEVKIMRETVYPGGRTSLGGGYEFSMLFKGLYNTLTNYGAYHSPVGNQSEAASFYQLLPAVFVALVLRPRLARGIGIVGWLLIFYIVFIVLFMLTGFPQWLAKMSLFSFTIPRRVDIGLGLGSILLVMVCLNATVRDAAHSRKWQSIVPSITAFVVVVFFAIAGLLLRKLCRHQFPDYSAIAFAACVMGVCAYLLAAGSARAFCLVMGTVVVLTSWFFNPLTRGFGGVYDGELASQIRKLNEEAGNRPLWLCYGPHYTSVLASAVGARSIAGIYYNPQFDIWHKLDPDRKYHDLYNRVGHFSLACSNQADVVEFKLHRKTTVVILISPYNAVLREMGARYVVATDSHQSALDAMNLTTLYESRDGWFTIYEIPRGESSDDREEDPAAGITDAR
jgi:hypothetical protein